MTKRKAPEFPLAEGQVFGPQTTRETDVVWRHPGVRILNAALDVPDGDVFTERTRTAVVRKQKASRSLGVTGTVDTKAWRSIVR